MIKNLSDFLSFITLISISAYALKLFAISKSKNDSENKISKLELFRDYINNEEE